MNQAQNGTHRTILEGLFAILTGAWVGGITAWFLLEAASLVQLILTADPVLRLTGDLRTCVLLGAAPGAAWWGMRSLCPSPRSLPWSVAPILALSLGFLAIAFMRTGPALGTSGRFQALLYPAITLGIVLIVARLPRDYTWREHRLGKPSHDFLKCVLPISGGAFFLLRGLLPSQAAFAGPVYWQMLLGEVLLIVGLSCRPKSGKPEGSNEPVQSRSAKGRPRVIAGVGVRTARLAMLWGAAWVLLGTLLPWGVDGRWLNSTVHGDPWRHGIDGLSSGGFGPFRDNGGMLVLGLTATLLWLVLSRPKQLSWGAGWAVVWAGGLLGLSVFHLIRLGLHRLYDVVLDYARGTLISSVFIDAYAPVFRWGNVLVGTVGSGLVLVIVGAGVMFWVTLTETESRQRTPR